MVSTISPSDHPPDNLSAPPSSACRHISSTLFPMTTFHEPISKAALKWVIDNELPGVSLTGRNKHLDVRLKKMLALIKDDALEVHYCKKLFDKNGEGHGRDYSSLPLSFQNLHRPIRNALINHYIATSGNRVVDIDVVNCHPEMFIQLCDRYHVEADFTAIERYITSRQSVLDMTQRDFGCDYEQAKALPLAVFNCGGLSGWAHKHDVEINLSDKAIRSTEAYKYISELIKQHLACVDELMTYSPKLVSLAKHSLARDEKDINKKSIAKRFIHSLLTISEDQVLHSMLGYIKANHDDATVISKMYDGSIVQCEEDIDMAAIKRHVESETGFVLDFVVKPFVSSISIPTNLASLPDYDDRIDKLARDPNEKLAAMFSKDILGSQILHLSDGFGWFLFQQPRWISVAETQLRRLIIERVCPIIQARYEACDVQTKAFATSMDDSDENKQALEDMEELRKLLCGLKFKFDSTCFQSNVMTQLKAMYELPGGGREWYESLDVNKHLVGFNDGVYDLKSNTFREGTPEDMISMSCGHSIADVKSVVPEVRSEIINALRDMVASDEEFELLFSTLASSVFGYTVGDTFNLWAGPGGNGKGVVKALAKSMLGSYFLEANTSTFLKQNKKSNPSDASPQIVVMDKKRCIMSSEANNDDEIDIALMKSITGGDNIQARDLHKSMVNISIHATLILMFNAIPAAQDDSDGIKRRLRMLEFPYSFCDSPSGEFEKPIDYSLRDRFATSAYGCQFLGLCIERFNESGVHFPVPQTCRDLAMQYLGENDVFGEFMKEFYEVTSEPCERLKPTDILRDLKSNRTYQDQLQINRAQDLCSRLRNKKFQIVTYRGYSRVNVKRKASAFIES